jgi:hypothetical protein
MDNMVGIEGLSKAAVLAALYNRAEPRGMGFLHYHPEPMTLEQAEFLIAGEPGRLDYDYLAGRCMKVDLSGDSFDPWLFDREYGQGAAQEVVTLLREADEINNLATQIAQQEGTHQAAEKAVADTKAASGWSIEDGVPVFTLSLDDVAEEIGEAVKRTTGLEPEEE